MEMQATTTPPLLRLLQVSQIEPAGETTSSASSRKSHAATARASEHPLGALPVVVPTPGVAALTAASVLGAASGSTPELPPATTVPLLRTSRTIIVIVQICGMLFFSSFCNGIIVVGLPAMQHELGLQEGLLVWPTSSYYLTAGSCLLLAGSIADVVGTKRVNLVGSLLAAVFALGCGLARSEGQLIGFRAVQGLANAIITPSSISIISNNVREGRPRNLGFASMGFTQPLGFCFGLVLGGVFIDTVGWRPAFYLAAAASVALVVVGIWALPRDVPRSAQSRSVWKRLASEIDWTGVLLASAGLAMLSYVLASLSADINEIRKAASIVLLILSGFSIPAFVLWMHYQGKHNRTALIPNSVWRNHVFTSSCLMVLFTNALTNCMELYSSLFFQSVQGNSALQASIRLLPSFVAGVAASLSTGIFVHRMPVMWTVLISCVASAGAPLLMALVPIDQIYWKNAFFGQILTPIACDLLFTVGLLIISDNFPKHMQALGGAVFNTCAQIGVAIGLSVTQVIASAVTNDSPFENKSSPEALMRGYRVSFWIMFGWMVFSCVVCVVGLRRVGAIGAKRD